MFEYFLEIPVKYSKCLCLLVNKSVINLDTRIPQNNDNAIPSICVVAKPKNRAKAKNEQDGCR